MEKNQYGIILDGKMDEPIWDTVPEYSGFHFLQSNGGGMQPEPTYFKILSCATSTIISSSNGLNISPSKIFLPFLSVSPVNWPRVSV